MSDRELLELAAKAAGILVDCSHGTPLVSGTRKTWNPLADDGDALRLAVRLQMIVCVRAEGKTDAAVRVTSFITPWRSFMEDHEADPYSATRRAIVCAAAAIGKGMS
jgi:hypothetical protein